MAGTFSFPFSAMMMLAAVLVLGVSHSVVRADDQPMPALRFSFSESVSPEGWTRVAPDELFSEQAGYGFEPSPSSGPRSFSVAVPEGNYRVSVTLGGAAAASSTTIKSELRRLMLEAVTTPPGQTTTREFVVNIRTPAISPDKQVGLKPREREMEWAAWDEKLTLEFAGEHPAVASVSIERVQVPTIYLLGDSTVCDQPHEPWASWGQMLPRWFKPDVAVANHAESGEALRSALNARRLDKILSLAKPGDWLLLQFGHNDMKARGQGVGAFTTYKSDLNHFVSEATNRQMNVILVTSCERKAGVKADTLGDYPEAVRQVAREQEVPLIDLHALSKTFYKALGPQLDKAFQDGTHHNNYGAYELAKIIVQEIKTQKLKLAEQVADDFPGFDASRPDDPGQFRLAPSTAAATTAPLGS